MATDPIAAAVIDEAAQLWPIDSPFPFLMDADLRSPIATKLHEAFPFLQALFDRFTASMGRDDELYRLANPSSDDISDVEDSPETKLALQAYIAAMRAVIHGYKL